MAAAKKPTPKVRKLQVKPLRAHKVRKQLKTAQPTLSNSWMLFKRALGAIKQHWRVFLTIGVIYLLLTLLMVKGFGIGTGLADLKASLQDSVSNGNSISNGFTLFGGLLTSSSTAANESASLYQSILLVIMSLAFIWTLRVVQNNEKVRARDAFYKGMYPLIPFLLVVLVICLQLLPLLVGSWLYSAVIVNAVVRSGGEQLLWGVIITVLATVSFYFLTSSIFALYIVTLPDMTPMKALRSAREIVRYRRWIVMRKVLALPLLLLVAGGILVIPFIILLAPVAEWLFFALTIAMLPVVHSYMYALYRELL